jgi:hypothetical protein
MSVLTRNRAKFEENEKKIWMADYAQYKKMLQKNPETPAEHFKKRRLQRPAIINLKKLPDYKCDFYFNSHVVYFLEIALLFMINAENIQSWFFEEEYVRYFFAEFQCGERANNLVFRLIERAKNPNIAREPVDDFLDQIGEPIRLLDFKQGNLPDTFKFAIYILSLKGLPEERLQLKNGLFHMEDFINSVVGKQVFRDEEEEDEEEEEHMSAFLQEPLLHGEQETSLQYVSVGWVDLPKDTPLHGTGKPEIIELIDEDEDTHRPLKRHYDEIIDLTSSTDDDI